MTRTADVESSIAPYVAAMMRVEGRIGSLVDQVRSLTVNAVLAVELVAIPASGVWEKSWEVLFSAVRVRNHGGAGQTLVVTNSPPAATAPIAGAGAFQVEAPGDVTFNLAGRNLAIYGVAGQKLSIEVYQRPVDPAGS